MSENGYLLELSAAPHLKGHGGVRSIMYQVILTLVPVCLYGIWLFGLSAAFLILTCTLVSIASERCANILSGKPSSIGDGSAAITGLLLALTLPPGLPLWMGAVGAFIAIIPGKALFGGLGCNIFNPTLVGRAFLQAAFPAAMADWTMPLEANRFATFIPSSLAAPCCKPLPVGGLHGVPPLVLQKIDHTGTDIARLLFGDVAGATGETCALLLLLCGAFLIARGVVNWRIPVAILGAALITSSVFYALDRASNPNPVFALLSGGLLLGALFLATDPVGSPLSSKGLWVFGAVIGALTILLRTKGDVPEGVMYAILIGNALTPLIDRWTQPQVFGHGRQRHG